MCLVDCEVVLPIVPAVDVLVFVRVFVRVIVVVALQLGETQARLIQEYLGVTLSSSSLEYPVCYLPHPAHCFVYHTYWHDGVTAVESP